MKDLGVVGTVARFKPVHKGHAAVLEAICERADRAIIGLGSTNKYDVNNPFTAQESREMIGIVLKRFNNYTIIEIPDLDHGPRWREQVLKAFGKLDNFVTANDYVARLLKHDYNILHTLTIIPGEKRFPVTGTIVRYTMACFSPWERLVPEQVADYIKTRKLDERFRREFGQTAIREYAGVAV
ncbi:adenylyltransferase/cytidyltransferase family protein [Candidatus Woesearchaeota archaeon]|nr:adenylyltransferase/cytidyltransferase family protein [Candidatus Woesearchaeota archaeon]